MSAIDLYEPSFDRSAVALASVALLGLVIYVAVRLTQDKEPGKVEKPAPIASFG